MPIRQMEWGAHIGHPIRVYRNLNNGRMSLQSKQGSSWKVVGHVENCVISSVKFHIGESGRQKVIRERCKNVHAWGQGMLVAEFDERVKAPVALSYNPYTDTTFKQRHTDNAIVQCQYLVVRDNQVFVSQDAVPEVFDPEKELGQMLDLVARFAGSRFTLLAA
jgi:hypothetical protein